MPDLIRPSHWVSEMQDLECGCILELLAFNALKVSAFVLCLRYFARSEIGTLGLHFLPVGGIQTATKQDLPKGCPMVGTPGRRL